MWSNILRRRARAAARLARSNIQNQPNPVGHIDTVQHITTGGVVVELDDDEDTLMEFGDHEPSLRDQEIESDTYRSHFFGSDAPIGGSSGGGLFGRSNTGGSGFGGRGPGGSGRSGISGGRGQGNSTRGRVLDVDVDNPPLPPGPNRITVGVEFELALAVSRRLLGLNDPHPKDGRWQSENLLLEKEENPLYLLSLRNHVIDTLRKHGVVASKTREAEIGLGLADTGWLQDLNDGRNCPNLPTLYLWESNYEWDPHKSVLDNCNLAARNLSNDFITFHADNHIELHRTKDESLSQISENMLPGFIRGMEFRFSPDQCMNIQTEIGERWLNIIQDERKRFEIREAKHIDPNLVKVPGADPRYFSWTCTVDQSITINNVKPHHYEIPADSILPPANPALRAIPEPPMLYKWWPGELKTPIYAYDNPETLETIRKACAALRDTYRIHKPMAATSTGLHIHFGQEKGWTLLQLKRFSTLWLLAEQSLEKLHREDRSKDNFFGLPMRNSCPISIALFRGVINPDARRNLPDTRNRDPHLSHHYNQIMNMHVPLTLPVGENFPQMLRDIIAEIWQYDTITGLNQGMTGYRDYGFVTYRLKGDKITVPKTGYTQTLEVRLMQGTLDADHIWKWMTICQGMIRFCKDATPEAYHNGLLGLLSATAHPADVIGVPQDYFRWFGERMNRRGYFEYPDADKVDWANPFMAPGYADVYDGIVVPYQ
ncbi:hypothetical protein F4805DRAFT_391763 [Annulohypoxylon moriforme]|nr:hypothetical protein F4805DRAFT_391763 [Annulohypoxylon moriforme]